MARTLRSKKAKAVDKTSVVFRLWKADATEWDLILRVFKISTGAKETFQAYAGLSATSASSRLLTTKYQSEKGNPVYRAEIVDPDGKTGHFESSANPVADAKECIDELIHQKLAEGYSETNPANVVDLADDASGQEEEEEASQADDVGTGDVEPPKTPEKKGGKRKAPRAPPTNDGQPSRKALKTADPDSSEDEEGLDAHLRTLNYPIKAGLFYRDTHIDHLPLVGANNFIQRDAVLATRHGYCFRLRGMIAMINGFGDSLPPPTPMGSDYDYELDALQDVGDEAEFHIRVRSDPNKRLIVCVPRTSS
jgi:hypothetical protein